MLGIGNAVGIPFKIAVADDDDYTADSTVITADSTIITADNEATI